MTYLLVFIEMSELKILGVLPPLWDIIKGSVMLVSQSAVLSTPCKRTF